MNGRRGEANAAVHKAAGKDEPVTQEIAMSVKGGYGMLHQRHSRRRLRQIAIVAPGKLKSTDGMYGLRFAHNTDVKVTGLTMKKN